MVTCLQTLAGDLPGRSLLPRYPEVANRERHISKNSGENLLELTVKLFEGSTTLDDTSLSLIWTAHTARSWMNQPRCSQTDLPGVERQASCNGKACEGAG